MLLKRILPASDKGFQNRVDANRVRCLHDDLSAGANCGGAAFEAPQRIAQMLDQVWSVDEIEPLCACFGQKVIRISYSNIETVSRCNMDQICINVEPDDAAGNTRQKLEIRKGVWPYWP